MTTKQQKTSYEARAGARRPVEAHKSTVLGRLWRMSWFRVGETPDAAKSTDEPRGTPGAAESTDDPRVVDYRIANMRLREFQDYVARGLDGEAFANEIGQRLVALHLVANSFRADLHMDRLDTIPPEILRAMCTLLDEELPQLIQQSRYARESMDSNEVDELLREGLVAIHVALHGIARTLTRIGNVALTRPETDAGLELRRQARYLRLKYLQKTDAEAGQHRIQAGDLAYAEDANE